MGQLHQRVAHQDLTSLHLVSDQMTTHRRLDPIPQMACVGGTANCQYKPHFIDCSKVGSNKWECVADLPKKYSLCRTDVV